VTARLSGGEPILRADHIDVWFGRRQALHGVNLDLKPGECTAIVGESGSGKTTLARCIVGLNGNWSGELTLDSARLVPDAGKRAKDQRRRLQYIFQNPYSSLNPRATVAQNLDEPLRFFCTLSRSERNTRIREALVEVALNGTYADRMPGHLSGGERQRVAIARALLVDPDVLVCDEITSALDVSVQATVVERLRRLQADRGLSMLFITHNLAVVSSIAQRVVVLSSGRVVEAGATAQVLESPQHPYTQQLIRDLPRMPSATQPERRLDLAEVAKTPG
jgi:peptide/nickel transport system ATP-binding protein